MPDHTARPTPFAVHPARPRRALVRAIDGAYARCLRSDPAPVDVDLARAQHAGYVAALEALGVEVTVLRADPAAPDGCFVEDVAVVLEDRALLTIPGAPSRRREVDAVGAALGGWAEVTRMREGTLDGGDVLRLGDRWLVGRSRRTDDAGVRELAAFVPGEVTPVEVPAGLHLKSAVTALDAETVVVDPGAMDPAALETLGLRVIGALEPEGANVLALGGVVLVSEAAPRTAEALEALRYSIRAIGLSEIHRGDGALSCLSLRLPPPGAWCA